MIDFRYHVVSIVAVFLALAIGIVLGATQLQGHTLDVLESTSSALRGELAATSAQRDGYKAQADAAGQFLQSAEGTLLAGRLAGRRLVLITEPGAQPAVISGVKQAAAAAGATVTGQVALQPRFNDISGATESSLAAISGSLAAADGVTLTPGTDSQTSSQAEAAQLIAAAVLAGPGTGTAASGSSVPASPSASPSSSASPSATAGQSGAGQSGAGQSAGAAMSAASAQTLLTAFASQGYLSVSGSVTGTGSGAGGGRATLTVIVTPQDAPAGGQDDPVNQVLLAITPVLADASAAAVAVGSTAAVTQQGSAISVLSGASVSAQVSTVNNADTTLGQITTVEALAAELAGAKPGSYGIPGAAAVAPDPLPSPAATATAPAAGSSGTGKSGTRTTGKRKK
jgi:hypothetical protein